ncbi:MAG: replicative DNA helicase [Chitinispirillia bacterium]|nr:replicative DNA helicase [Chitinispirillia bacterium]MCL2240970.1 replicative DNA helicase [Chitinispirillia bacterium]
MQTKKIKKTAEPAAGADRVPPQSLDAERTILGSMLIDDVAVDVAIEFLSEDNFYSDAHSKIFICMRELSEVGTPVDIITVSEKLRRKEWIEAVGTEAYLAELAESVATSGNVQYYASIVREKSVLRQLINAAGEITTECFSGDRETQDVLDDAERKIFGIAESRIKNKFESIGQILPQTWKVIESYANPDAQLGVPTGFTDLDRLTTGLHRGDLVVVGGRPSMGKTAFCLAVALNAAVRAKRSTAIFSLEMTKDSLVQRMLCSEAKVNMHHLRSGTLPSTDHGRLGTAAGPLYEAPIYIDDTPGINVLELRAKARRLKAQYGLDLIIVDYLQLMTPHVKSESTQQDISLISRSLKAVARELEVPLIALSQLSRSVESRPDKRPLLSDLRDSGAIEQDADVVMFVYREEKYKPDDPALEGKAEIIVGKQRNGPVGKVEVAFVKKYAGFENLAAHAGMPPDLPEDFSS